MQEPSLKYAGERGMQLSEGGRRAGPASRSCLPIGGLRGPPNEEREPHLMKRLFALVATALLAVALYAATAQSGQEAVSPAQFRALSAKVTKIRKDLDATIGVMATCVMGTAIPITRYSGYVSVDQSNQTFSTTALDLTDTGDTPNGFALLVSGDQACVNLINGSSLKRLTAFKPILRAGARPSFAHARRH
jgi:hypothetical protein